MPAAPSGPAIKSAVTLVAPAEPPVDREKVRGLLSCQLWPWGVTVACPGASPVVLGPQLWPWGIICAKDSHAPLGVL